MDNNTENKPWSFVIEIDEGRCKNLIGYNKSQIYDYIQECLVNFEIKRINKNTWKTEGKRMIETQVVAISRLSKNPYIMQCIESFTVYELDPNHPIDFLEIIRDVVPERLCE